MGPTDLYRLTVYDPDRLQEILHLQRALWSQDEGANTDYFTWKYEENPFLRRPRIFMALSGDEIVGVRGFHGTAWRFDGEGSCAITPTGGDTVIAPDHRSRWLFERMNRFALSRLAAEGFSVVVNFSAAPVTYLRSVRSGWRAVGSYAPWGRDRVAGDGRRPPSTAGSVALEAEPRPTSMADLVRRCEDPRSIRLERSRTFFEWRYRNPLSRYHFLYAGSDPLEGYMVLQERLLKRQHGMRIVDWEAVDPPTFERLLSAAITYITTQRLTIWSATLPSAVQAILSQAGFEPLDDTGGGAPLSPRSTGSSDWKRGIARDLAVG